LEATVKLKYPDEKTAEAVTNAISPDNFKTPIGLRVKTVREDTKVITQIRCEGKLITLTATIDDLLFSASTAEKTLRTIKKI
jgi:cell fate regulator YaaT (PSP1 superfamily)